MNALFLAWFFLAIGLALLVLAVALEDFHQPPTINHQPRRDDGGSDAHVAEGPFGSRRGRRGYARRRGGTAQLSKLNPKLLRSFNHG